MMADMQHATATPQEASSLSRPISSKQTSPLQIPPPSKVALPPPTSASQIRNSHLILDSFSPVNQNGSFECDRVIKSGYVQKRTRKTKNWKPIYLVLRPNSLSIYKDQNEGKLKHKIHLSDLTAVAKLKDPKQKRHNVFGLFSPSRNYHLESTTKGDTEEWVNLIRQEARIEEEEEELLLGSPGGLITSSYAGLGRAFHLHSEQRRIHDDRVGSSSPEPTEPISKTSKKKMTPITAARRLSQTIDYSGNELASQSDFSDMEINRVPGASTLSFQEPLAVKPPSSSPRPPYGARNASQLSGFNMDNDPERVVWQGNLLYLKSKGGVRQWKSLWAVIRRNSISLYKNDSEYSIILLIRLPSVINAVEIDPLSKTKRHCLQVITEEKSYKFCARDEDTLDKALGALKSLLAKRKEGEIMGRSNVNLHAVGR